MENNNGDILDALTKANNVVIPLHIRPDGDSFGSTLAMHYFLESMGKKTTVVSSDTIRGTFELFEDYKIVKWGTDLKNTDLTKYDSLISLDVSEAYRFVKDGESNGYKIPDNIFTIAIDHHLNFTSFGNINYHFIDKSSTSEIIYDLLLPHLENNKNRIKVLEMVLVGILSDTGFLKWAISPEVIKKVEAIMREVDYKRIWEILLYNNSLENKKFQAIILKNAIYNKEKRFAYSKISYKEIIDNNIPDGELGGGADLLKDIMGFDFSFVLREVEVGKVFISFRSQKGVDVSVFPPKLGNGGGHKMASGAFVFGKSLEEVEAEAVRVVSN